MWCLNGDPDLPQKKKKSTVCSNALTNDAE